MPVITALVSRLSFYTGMDAKQFTGLNTCQERSENKLDFHFNAALTNNTKNQKIVKKRLNYGKIALKI